MSPTKITASQIAEFLEASLLGIDRQVVAVAPIGDPAEGALTFVLDPVKHVDATARALATGSVVLLPSWAQIPEVANASMIVVDNPRAAYAAAAGAFFAPRVEPGIHPTAIVDTSAFVADSAHIGPYAIIGAGCSIGERVEIRAHVVLGRDVVIGEGSLIKSNAVIGEEGFGFDRDPDGNNIRLPHLGSVVLGKHTEVGCFTTVCSGTISPTRVGNYTKIDDHVHIAHNVQLGSNVTITGCAEISGSVVVGDGAWFGPNSSVLEGLTIGTNSVIGIGAVVRRSVPDEEVYFGNPARKLVIPREP